MLTYRTGAAGAPSAARFMSEHLLQQTLPPAMAAMAEYYEQGVTPPTQAEAAASRYGHLAIGGVLPKGEALDELVNTEAMRLAESALKADGGELDSRELQIHSIAAFVGANLVDQNGAFQSFGRLGLSLEPERLEAMIAEATTGRDYSSATAVPRRDMNPALAKRLGIDTRRGLKQSEVAFLLNGQRADGELIEGRTKRSATLPLRTIFRLGRTNMPSRDQLNHMLAGKTASGETLPEAEAQHAVRRLLFALGVKAPEVSPQERENILNGLAASGRPLSDREYQTLLDASKTRIGYIDFTFSAPKSVSIAWAFAPTKAEQAIIHQAHKDAIDSVMKAIEPEIGRARKGRHGKAGYDPGAVGWVSFDHYTSRPTVEVIRHDSGGEAFTELHTLSGTGGRVPGDMQIHTHVAVFNAVETESGRLGGLDLAQLEGRIHEWGALYQAYLADSLRRHGVEIGLDPRTEMARISSIPESVVAHFSKRTLGGTEAAREYARTQGIDWDSLDADRKVGLLKAGVQNPREAKSDDVSDLASWRRMSSAIGYSHRSVLRPDAAVPVVTRAERLETAYHAALPLLSKQFYRRAVIDGTDARVAAAKGLIQAGVEAPEDVNVLTQAFRERGVKHGGEDTALLWGTVGGKQGRERVAVTTALHEREENSLISHARAAAADKSSALSPKAIASAIAAFPEIDFDNAHGQAQRAIIEQIGRGCRLALAIGVAGSGKSTLLKPLVRAWQDDGRNVHGVALAWRQSDDLAEAGINPRDTRAVEAFLRAIKAGRLQLDRKSVVVLDEIGLLGTRQLNDILAAQNRHGFQLAMIGDPKQMQAVEAGPVISLLRRALGEEAVPELGTSVRQRGDEERETTLMFRNGQTAAAIARKDKSGTLHIVPGGYQEAVAGVASIWQERREANRERPDFTISISAPTNYDAHEISKAIRAQRRRLGEIGVDKMRLKATDGAGRDYELVLAEGDRVRLFKRTNATFSDTGRVGNIGRNGTVLEITEILEDGLLLKGPSARTGFVGWTGLRATTNSPVQLAYGDALTTNTAQGSTVTEHIHALPAGSRLVSAFGAYTSGSRHREISFIVTSDGAERSEVIRRRPLGDRREISRSDVIENIVRNFSRQPEKESTLQLIDRAANLRRGSIHTFQRGIQPLEARAARQKPPSELRARLDRRRQHTIFEKRFSEIAQNLTRHATTFLQIGRLGTVIAERISRTIQSRAAKRHHEAEYWQKFASDRTPNHDQLEANKIEKRGSRHR